MKTKEDVRRDNIYSLCFCHMVQLFMEDCVCVNTGNVETTIFAGLVNSKEQVVTVALSWQNPSSVTISQVSFVHQGLLFSKDEAFNDDKNIRFTLRTYMWDYHTPAPQCLDSCILAVVNMSFVDSSCILYPEILEFPILKGQTNIYQSLQQPITLLFLDGTVSPGLEKPVIMFPFL